MLIDDLSKIPDQFKIGYRGVLLLKRNKDGKERNADRKVIKKITCGVEEWESTIRELRNLQQTQLPNHRIYASINERNMNSSLREFRQRQLDNDYNTIDLMNEFYCDIQNRFFSCFMNPKNKRGGLFLIDCDSIEEYHYAKSLMQVKQIESDIIFEYRTRNGFHIITRPFNPDIIKGVEIKKDALLAIG
jgi:hypothetical protein